MIALPKLVWSRTLAKVEWNNAQLINDHLAEEILKLNRQSGKDLALFASANLLATRMQPDIIDEYRIIVNPVILGNGQPLSKSTMNKHDLNLL